MTIKYMIEAWLQRKQTGWATSFTNLASALPFASNLNMKSSDVKMWNTVEVCSTIKEENDNNTQTKPQCLVQTRAPIHTPFHVKQSSIIIGYI